MLNKASVTSVEEAVPAQPNPTKRMSAAIEHRRSDINLWVGGFTLVELLVSIGVLVLLVFLASQLFNSAATVTMLGHKQMDADSQARQVLDRMALDFAQMVKRSDVDYYVKSSWFASGTPPPPPGVTGVRTLLQPGNDRIAFYSAVPGYYPDRLAKPGLARGLSSKFRLHFVFV